MRIFWESFSPRSCLWLHGLDKCKWVRVPPTRSSSLWQWPLKPDDGACNRTPDNRAAEKKEYQEYPGPFQHGMWLLRLLALERLGEGEGATGGPRCCPEKAAVHPKVDAFVATHQAVNWAKFKRFWRFTFGRTATAAISTGIAFN